ncbi:hypothetical protein BN7_3558 [Wickerhamomyces ciferrii]|uniref:Transcription regulator Rua1 C-terminal domain-containing protein n=1 Tax=Wickerhamomyces ciferrii (strain ATCC 14091 / BCRC 22168 / CBS 111 / JCM 3599 / NBRC 0793 / NRRL Y-1031 F-60-10) TaxID=1206466 RepID=K0KRN6_WICCF|nr:uncharacterized protein BN7_3558 [Wickerhamomyces ciferrii]CCH44003.1 hypothetical protein BN7_3558 [Wickerhamomyces ciferrii]
MKEHQFELQSNDRLDWFKINVDHIQDVNIHAVSFQRFKDKLHNLTELNAHNEHYGKIQPNYVDPLLKDARIGYAKDSSNFETGIVDAVVCPYCDPFECVSSDFLSVTSYSLEDDGYEYHLRSIHGIFADGSKVTQPFIGDTFIYDDNNGSELEKKKSLVIVCSHHLDGDKEKACLASFYLDDSDYPLSEYFDHYYSSHVLHKEDPSSIPRYIPICHDEENPGWLNFKENLFVPIDPHIHCDADLHLSKSCTDITLQPFVLPQWDDVIFTDSRLRNKIANRPIISKNYTEGYWIHYNRLSSRNPAEILMNEWEEECKLETETKANNKTSEKKTLDETTVEQIEDLEYEKQLSDTESVYYDSESTIQDESIISSMFVSDDNTGSNKVNSVQEAFNELSQDLSQEMDFITIAPKRLVYFLPPDPDISVESYPTRDKEPRRNTNSQKQNNIQEHRKTELHQNKKDKKKNNLVNCWLHPEIESDTVEDELSEISDIDDQKSPSQSRPTFTIGDSDSEAEDKENLESDCEWIFSVSNRK